MNLSFEGTMDERMKQWKKAIDRLIAGCEPFPPKGMTLDPAGCFRPVVIDPALDFVGIYSLDQLLQM